MNTQLIEKSFTPEQLKAMTLSEFVIEAGLSVFTVARVNTDDWSKAIAINNIEEYRLIESYLDEHNFDSNELEFGMLSIKDDGLVWKFFGTEDLEGFRDEIEIRLRENYNYLWLDWHEVNDVNTDEYLKNTYIGDGFYHWDNGLAYSVKELEEGAYIYDFNGGYTYRFGLFLNDENLFYAHK